MLYKAAMQKYQQANNADKMLEMAQKALAFDADDPEALVDGRTSAGGDAPATRIWIKIRNWRKQRKTRSGHW